MINIGRAGARRAQRDRSSAEFARHNLKTPRSLARAESRGRRVERGLDGDVEFARSSSLSL